MKTISMFFVIILTASVLSLAAIRLIPSRPVDMSAINSTRVWMPDNSSIGEEIDYRIPANGIELEEFKTKYGSDHKVVVNIKIFAGFLVTSYYVREGQGFYVYANDVHPLDRLPAESMIAKVAIDRDGYVFFTLK